MISSEIQCEADDEMHVHISITYVARRYSYINFLLIQKSDMLIKKLSEGDNSDCELLLFCKIYLRLWWIQQWERIS